MRGANEVGRDWPLPAWLRVWRCYSNPFNLLLSALAVLSLLDGDAPEIAAIVAMVVLSTPLRLVQEGRSHQTDAA